jgi:hypothetical protein
LDKVSRTGQRNSCEILDNSAKDILAKDILAKDILAKDISAKDILEKDILEKDISSQLPSLVGCPVLNDTLLNVFMKMKTSFLKHNP